MGENSKIEWCHHTFNIVWGCTKVSPACANCYAEAWSHRMGFDVWGADKPRRFMGVDYWRQPLKWDRAAEAVGERRRVFCSSMADVFEGHKDLHEPRLRLWELIEQTPHLDWLLLTKRPENFHMLPTGWRKNPRPNVWLGVTAENQEWANRRIPLLLQTPAAVRFVSAEPLLGPLDLEEVKVGCGWRSIYCACSGECEHATLDWVIAGGESGHGARAMRPDWARKLRDQCEDAGVAFLFKQWGEYAPAYPPWGYDAEGQHPDDDAAGYIEVGPRESIKRVGKKQAGRVLDGREWNQFPALASTGAAEPR